MKGKSAIKLFDLHHELKRWYWGRHFWAKGYCVSTIGLDEDQIRKGWLLIFKRSFSIRKRRGFKGLVLWDKFRLDRGFAETMNLLRQTRFTAIMENRVLITKFQNKNIIVSDGKSDHILNNRRISTLANVNYDTTLGKNMIVFSGRVTCPHNIRIHGGDLTSRSWLGFKMSIHVNRTGLAREGCYPSD